MQKEIIIQKRDTIALFLLLVASTFQIELFGRNFSIPNNYHDVLVNDYGYNYMVPDPNYRPGKRNNVNYINNKKGIFQSY